GGAGARFEILLVLQPRLAEMDLGVDEAGQKMQARAVYALAGIAARQIAERGEAAAANADIGAMGAVVVDEGAACIDRVECLGHGTGLLLSEKGCPHTYAAEPRRARRQIGARTWRENRSSWRTARSFRWRGRRRARCWN